MVEDRILDSFQLMWGPFPEPVMLIQKDRTILAVNELGRKFGIPVGAKCHSLNPEVKPGEDHCGRCQANRALKSGETVRISEERSGHRMIGYWMPLREVPDVYVHFGIGTGEAMGATK